MKPFKKMIKKLTARMRAMEATWKNPRVNPKAYKMPGSLKK